MRLKVQVHANSVLKFSILIGYKMNINNCPFFDSLNYACVTNILL